MELVIIIIIIYIITLSLSSYRATLEYSVFQNLPYISINSELTQMKSHRTLNKYVECIFLTDKEIRLSDSMLDAQTCLIYYT
jgi:hypothetical protein